MDANIFDQIVKSRAKQRVNERYAEFKRSVGLAMRSLGVHLPDVHLKLEDAKSSESYRYIRATLLSAVCVDAKLPPYLWTEEEKLVSDELLSTLDEITKAVISLSEKDEASVNPLGAEDNE